MNLDGEEVDTKEVEDDIVELDTIFQDPLRGEKSSVEICFEGYLKFNLKFA